MVVPRRKDEPMTAAEKTEASEQKSQYLTFGLTKHHEMLHNLA